MSRESKSDFARRLGVNRSSVTRWAQDGRVVVVDGQIEVEASLARLEATRDPNREDVRQRHAKVRDEKRSAKDDRGASDEANRAAMAFSGVRQGEDKGGEEKTPPAVQNATTQTDDATAEAYRRFRAVKMHFNARQATVRVAMLRGKLADVASIMRAGAHAGATVRSTLENLPDQAASRLAPLRDPAAVAALFGHLLDDVLTQFDAVVAKDTAALRKVAA